MFDTFMFGFLDQLEKAGELRPDSVPDKIVRGARAVRKGGLKSVGRGAKAGVREVKRGAKAWEESGRAAREMEPRGGLAASMVKDVQGKIKGMKEGRLKKVLRRGAHEVRKAVHQRKAELEPETAAKAKKVGAKVVEMGAHAPKPVRSVLKWGVSQAQPLKKKVIVGGRSKEAPGVAKHEIGHLSGHAAKSPALSQASAMATRQVGPAVAKGLAMMGKKRTAKAIQGAADIGTLAEEGRAWAHGIGKDVVRSAKKGDIKGVAKQLKDPAIGLGSYALGAKSSQKMLSQLADKAQGRKLLKKFPKAKVKP